MKPTLVLLAAGMGSRYGGLKQLERLGPGGETLMDYSVFDALRANFGKVVFVIRRDIEDEFKKVIGARYSGSVQVEYAFQELADLPAGFTPPPGRVKPWGTGHALRAARDIVREPFAVINADDFYGRDSYVKLYDCLTGVGKAAVGAPVSGCMCGFILERTLSENGSVSRGVCATDAAGMLSGVIEHTAISRRPDGLIADSGSGTEKILSPEVLVSMNCWGFAPDIFPALEKEFAAFLDARGTELKSEFYIPAAVDSLIAAGVAQIRMLRTEARWFGVTYQEDKPGTIAALARMATSGEYPARLFGA